MRLFESEILSRRPWRIIFASFFIAIIVLQIALARPVLNTMLLDSVRSSSAKLASYLMDEMAPWTLGVVAGGVDNGHHDEERLELIGGLAAALATTTVRQIDLIRSDCMCAVSLGQGLPAQSDASGADDISIHGALQEFFAGQIPQGRTIGFGDRLIGIDAEILGRVANSGKPDMRLLPGAPLASAVFASNSPGQPDMMVRLVMDLTDRAFAQKVLLGLLGIILTAVSGAVMATASRAITTSRRKGERSERQARFFAERDPLTRLYNRRGFRIRAEAMLGHCKEKGRRACLIQYDADGLKSVNDLHGHPTGDRILVDIADQIRAIHPSSALIARIGSDEFAVLDEVANLPPGIAALSSSTVDANARELAVSTSAGFAFYPDDGGTLFQLMQSADLALMSAKKTTATKAIAYRSNMSDSFQKRAWEIKGFREALREGQIEPYYQPLFDAKTQKLEGLEALVRWNHPELGTLNPRYFESALDEPSIAVELTRNMLELMLTDLAGWWAMGHRFSAGLNVGEYDLRHPGFLEMIDTALREHDLPPNALAIEVTERAVNAANLEAVLPILNGLRARGLFVALDDFGTGTSSLTLLRALPRTAIKIDKSFIRHVVRNDGDRAIVRALVQLGHDLQTVVVAEGVESEDQVELLQTLDVDIFQGFLFGKPAPASEITMRLKDWKVAQKKDNAQFNTVTKLEPHRTVAKRAVRSRLG